MMQLNLPGFMSSPSEEALADGVTILRGYSAHESAALVAAANHVAASAPFRQMTTPGGHLMSVAMTNCGKLGWVTDHHGYRYDRVDPETKLPWPTMPAPFTSLAIRAATHCGYSEFLPDACLINRYEPSARLSLHQDKNEGNLAMPIVSVSLGLAATFLLGGSNRRERPRRIRLQGGDVMVWGGSSRLVFHGVAPLPEGRDPLTGRYRINLTFRMAQ